VPNFVSFMASIAELAHGEKSHTQSLTNSINKSLNHPAYLMPRKLKLLLRNNETKARYRRILCHLAQTIAKTQLLISLPSKQNPNHIQNHLKCERKYIQVG